MMLWVAVCNTEAKTIYLNTGGTSLWEKDGANKFAIWHWQGSQSGAWSSWMTRVDGNVWKVDVSDSSDKVIFCRFNNSASSPDWNADKWNQTEDLMPGSNNLFTITGWGNDKSQGAWSMYDASGSGNQGGGDNPGGGTPVTPGDYATAVPSQCEDVMLQAFYWNSNNDNTYGTSKWTALQSQASEISQYFQMVWLPPSCYSKSGSMGYLPARYSQQKSSMGSETELKSLIAAFHNGGVRVLADVVINHAGNQSTWINFFEQDFGSYGKFSPQSTWITSNDEAQGKGTLGTNADDGQEANANYPSARDWDHKNTQVQAMCRAYLKYLIGEIGYDGFRFDYCGGYHVSHINDYVSAAKPYFSVMEYWNGNASILKQRINDAGKNTLTFDFAGFYTCYQQGIAVNNYGKLVNSGLRGQGYAKYAVNFVDNHDTFNRSDINNSDCGNSKDGSSSLNNKELIMQCNAYMLSMPGVPCVFWPHWYKYKSEIKAMITARRRAGIHSESSVQETSGNGYYEATITGKYGNVIVYLGSSANKAAPQGYTQAVKGGKYAMYYTGNGNMQGIERTPVETSRKNGEKFLKDGQLYIRLGENVYDVRGNKIN